MPKNFACYDSLLTAFLFLLFAGGLKEMLITKLDLFILTCLADFICKFIKSRLSKEDYSKVLNLLLLNIASQCEKVLRTFLIAFCIWEQTGQRLLHKSTFSYGMSK